MQTSKSNKHSGFSSTNDQCFDPAQRQQCTVCSTNLMSDSMNELSIVTSSPFQSDQLTSPTIGSNKINFEGMDSASSSPLCSLDGCQDGDHNWKDYSPGSLLDLLNSCVECNPTNERLEFSKSQNHTSPSLSCGTLRKSDLALLTNTSFSELDNMLLNCESSQPSITAAVDTSVGTSEMHPSKNTLSNGFFQLPKKPILSEQMFNNSSVHSKVLKKKLINHHHHHHRTNHICTHPVGHSSTAISKSEEAKRCCHHHHHHHHNHSNELPFKKTILASSLPTLNYYTGSSSSSFSSRSNSLASLNFSALDSLLEATNDEASPTSTRQTKGNSISDPHALQKSNAPFYCHWGDECNEVAFTNENEFDMHLKSFHLNLDKNNIPQPQSPEQQKTNNFANKRSFDESCEVGSSDDENDDASNTNKFWHCNWDHCNTELTELDDILEHIKMDHGVSNRKYPHSVCSTSNYNGKNNSGSDNQVSINKQQQYYTPPASNTPTPSQLLACRWNDCGYSAPDLAELETHELAKHHPAATAAQANGISLFQCEWKACTYRCTDMEQFMSHVRNEHVSMMMGKSSSDNEDAATTEIKLETPLAISTSVSTPAPASAPAAAPAVKTESEASKMHVCSWLCGPKESETECGEVFDSTQALHQHVVDHHIGSRQPSYICRWAGCERHGRPFPQRQKIHRHLITHTKNKPYTCTVCGAAFSESVVLTQHMRIHSGERPFKCPEPGCGKRFAASTALSVHMRTHTGEKPLKCKIPGCGKRFSESSNLAKHMKTHQAERPFACTRCSRRFARNDQLQRHVRTAHDQPVTAMEEAAAVVSSESVGTLSKTPISSPPVLTT